MRAKPGPMARAHGILSWTARGCPRYRVRVGGRYTTQSGSKYEAPASSSDADPQPPNTPDEKACPCSLPADDTPQPPAQLALDDGERRRLDALLSPGNWTFSRPPTADTFSLSREFVFKGFKKAFAFMTLVAGECSKQQHHPEWTNVYNNVTVRWTTHRPRGLTGKDVLMAEACDRFARECGEKPKS